MEHMWGRRVVYKVLMGKPDRKRPLEDPGLDGILILRWTFKKYVEACTGLLWLRIGISGGLL